MQGKTQINKWGGIQSIT